MKKRSARPYHYVSSFKGNVQLYGSSYKENVQLAEINPVIESENTITQTTIIDRPTAI